jgi:hypothetical protein
MIMMDVRNAITGILDRYTLADIVEVTLRKMRRDGVPLPFSTPPQQQSRGRVSVRATAEESAAALEDYSI